MHFGVFNNSRTVANMFYRNINTYTIQFTHYAHKSLKLHISIAFVILISRCKMGKQAFYDYFREFTYPYNVFNSAVTGHKAYSCHSRIYLYMNLYILIKSNGCLRQRLCQVMAEHRLSNIMQNNFFCSSWVCITEYKNGYINTVLP